MEELIIEQLSNFMKLCDLIPIENKPTNLLEGARQFQTITPHFYKINQLLQSYQFCSVIIGIHCILNPIVTGLIVLYLCVLNHSFVFLSNLQMGYLEH